MTNKTQLTIRSIFFGIICPKEYFDFLQKNGKKKKNEVSGESHLHHIIPKYWFFENSTYLPFMNTEFNLIYLSRDDHAFAHFLLYKLAKDNRDLSAFYMLCFNKHEALKHYRIAGAKAAHLLLKKRNQSFWNSEIQKNNAKKSLSKINARVTRSLGGNKGRYQRNKNRIITKTTKLLFLFESQPFLCIFNCQTGGDIVSILNQAKLSN